MHNCVFTCIEIFPHYDEYRREHHETNCYHHVCHNATTFVIPFGCAATVRQRVLARPAGLGGVRAHWWAYIHTCGPYVEKYYTSNLARIRKSPKRMK